MATPMQVQIQSVVDANPIRLLQESLQKLAVTAQGLVQPGQRLSDAFDQGSSAFLQMRGVIQSMTPMMSQLAISTSPISQILLSMGSAGRQVLTIVPHLTKSFDRFADGQHLTAAESKIFSANLAILNKVVSSPEFTEALGRLSQSTVNLGGSTINAASSLAAFRDNVGKLMPLQGAYGQMLDQQGKAIGSQNKLWKAWTFIQGEVMQGLNLTSSAAQGMLLGMAALNSNITQLAFSLVFLKFSLQSFLSIGVAGLTLLIGRFFRARAAAKDLEKLAKGFQLLGLTGPAVVKLSADIQAVGREYAKLAGITKKEDVKKATDDLAAATTTLLQRGLTPTADQLRAIALISLTTNRSMSEVASTILKLIKPTEFALGGFSEFKDEITKLLPNWRPTTEGFKLLASLFASLAGKTDPVNFGVERFSNLLGFLTSELQDNIQEIAKLPTLTEASAEEFQALASSAELVAKATAFVDANFAGLIAKSPNLRQKLVDLVVAWADYELATRAGVENTTAFQLRVIQAFSAVEAEVGVLNTTMTTQIGAAVQQMIQDLGVTLPEKTTPPLEELIKRFGHLGDVLGKEIPTQSRSGTNQELQDLNAVNAVGLTVATNLASGFDTAFMKMISNSNAFRRAIEADASAVEAAMSRARTAVQSLTTRPPTGPFITAPVGPLRPGVSTGGEFFPPELGLKTSFNRLPHPVIASEGPQLNTSVFMTINGAGSPEKVADLVEERLERVVRHAGAVLAGGLPG